MKKKIILLIADGLGDRPIESLNGLTPLEIAKTNHLDRLATSGTTGIVDLYGPGIPVGTDFGHMALFGYDLKDYTERGPIEAFGVGLEMEAGDIAFRCNFATKDGDILVDRRAGRIRKDTDILAKSLNGIEIDGVTSYFKESAEHRGVLVLRGKGLSADILDTDPKLITEKTKHIIMARPSKDSKEANYTKDIVNKFLNKFHEILKNHPVNIKRQEEKLLPANWILIRGAGYMPNIEKISDRYNIKGQVIASTGTVLGVGRLSGFSTRTHETFTGNLDTNILLKGDYAINALKDNDFVALNYKATDVKGHDNDPQGKVKAIEVFDELVGYVDRKRDKNVILAVAADHSTPCEMMEHSGEPIPVLINGKSVRRDRNNYFNEIDCSHGGLGRLKGKEFSNILYDYLEVTKRIGN